MRSASSNVNLTAEKEANDFLTNHINGFTNELSLPITIDELQDGISHLKAGKAAGPDLILNDMLKAAFSYL